MGDSSSRNMPTWKQVAKYWSSMFIKHDWEVDHEILYNKQCFACGRHGKIQRCHIKPKWNGGSDDVKNIHLLCVACHEESESIYGLAYWRWYKHKRNVEFFQILEMEVNRFIATYPHLYKQALKERGVKP